MRILIACDSFKDALSAEEVCQAIEIGLLRSGRPGLEVRKMALSDGGEGVLEILRRRVSLTSVHLEVCDPLFRPVTASYGISADGATVLVEMAGASGLQRLTIPERDPLLTSTFGTGQLLADARARGAKHVLLALGGSATNDAGIGAAAALGWQFSSASGRAVRPIGGCLQDVARIVAPSEPLFDRMTVLCDVTNPLFGANGAALQYGGQKGGNARSLHHLDSGLRHIAALVEEQLSRKGLAEIPGAGAAGGFGFGAVAFMNATLKRGIDMVLDAVGFEEVIAEIDLIITGEGRLDTQSGQGKLIQGVCSRAGKVPVIALCGALSITPEEVKAIGLEAAYSINPVERPLTEMLRATARNLEKAAAALFSDAPDPLEHF